jgi:8-oxo-dGTP pyrophosphatase MutT (NUDIX family)
VEQRFPGIEELAEALLGVPAPELAGAELEAAVLVCLHRESVLLIRRQDREGDRWSGHIGFPGGRHEAADQTLLETALRETEEELGFRATDYGRVLGTAGTLESRRFPGDVRIAIFVAELNERPPLQPSDEVTAAFWVPVDALTPATSTVPELPDPVSSYVVSVGDDKLVVWGITYQILELLRAAR